MKPTKSLIDCHVHLAALPDSDNGCFISPKLLRSPLFRFLLWKHDLSPAHPQEANQKYLEHLLTELHASRYVQKVVLLGMDGFYDQTCLLNRQHTDFLVSNDYVFKTVQAHPDVFLAGPSINPQREDAIDEVHRCADAGAVLIKVLPNAQHFNPADPRYRSFYRALAQRKLPFLSHVGYEFSLIGKDQSLGDPDRLRLALEEGDRHRCPCLQLRPDAVRFSTHETYATLSTSTPIFRPDQPHRLKMLLHLRHHRTAFDSSLEPIIVIGLPPGRLGSRRLWRCGA